MERPQNPQIKAGLGQPHNPSQNPNQPKQNPNYNPSQPSHGGQQRPSTPERGREEEGRK